MRPQRRTSQTSAGLAYSSGESGFFQTTPVLSNQLRDDWAYQRVASFFLPPDCHRSLIGTLESFADFCIHPDTLAFTADAERNQPFLSTHSTFGVPESTLVTSEGWRKLTEIQVLEGIVAIPFENSPVRRTACGLNDRKYEELRKSARKWSTEEAALELKVSSVALDRSRGHPQILPVSNRLHQFLKYHLWSASSATVTCPAAMTDGAAKLLERHILSQDTPTDHREIFVQTFYRLTSRNPAFAWTSGQWMTERTGGSDVRKTETCAFHKPTQGTNGGLDAHGNPLGDWSVRGFKWFSSATDSDIAVLLARTDENEISAFFAPLRRRISGQEMVQPTEHAGPLPILRTRPGTMLNGVQIQRLKPKLGTKALPTAELILKDMRAYPIGQRGKGTKEIATILNITRIYNAASAMAGLGRGLAVARAFARVRRIGGGKQLLRNVPAHVRTMAAAHISYRAHLFLTFLVITILGAVEAEDYAGVTGWTSEQSGTSLFAPEGSKIVKLPASKLQKQGLLRILTPVIKILTAKVAISGLSECCEMLGGVGYLEYPNDVGLNVARLLRDAQVLSIWEGTSDVLADDLVRVLKGRGGDEIQEGFKLWVDTNVNSIDPRFQEAIKAKLQEFHTLVASSPPDQLLYRGREIAGLVGWISSSLMLGLDATLAERNKDPTEMIVKEIAQRWIGLDGWTPGPYFNNFTGLGTTSYKNEFQIDRQIVFGLDESVDEIYPGREVKL